MNRRDALKTMSMAAAAAGFVNGSDRSGGRLAGSGTASVRRDAKTPPKQKMVMIGAGSAMFTQGIIIDWINRRPEGEWEIALVDINPVILEATDKLVRRYMLSAEVPAKITSTVNRREVLSGATIVICTIGVGSRRAWEQDVFVPRKFGINQPVGDSVMPGGISRAMRMIPPMVDIAMDSERLCPEARFINYSNPMPMVLRALWRRTKVRALGLCMGTEETVHYLAQFAGLTAKTVSARYVGLNHLTWITDLRTEGRDAWPAVRARLAERRGNGIDRTSWGAPFGQEKKPDMLTHPFSWELFDEYGAFPAPMDRHVTEYFPQRFPGGRYYGSTLGVDAYSFERTIARGDRIYDETISLARDPGPVDPKRLRATGGEHMQTMDILSNFYYDRRQEYAVNVPNRGAVSNLPADAIVEIPGVTTQEGMAPLPVGEIPSGLAAVLLHRTSVVEAAVEAALSGNRKMMVEAMLLDGAVADYGTAEKLTDALLRAQAEHLPQFA